MNGGDGGHEIYKGPFVQEGWCRLLDVELPHWVLQATEASANWKRKIKLSAN